MAVHERTAAGRHAPSRRAREAICCGFPIRSSMGTSVAPAMVDRESASGRSRLTCRSGFSARRSRDVRRAASWRPRTRRNAASCSERAGSALPPSPRWASEDLARGHVMGPDAGGGCMKMTHRVARPMLLVLGARSLAEFLASVPAYRALADVFPSHKRVLVAPALLRSIVRLCGCFDQLIPVENPARLPQLERPDVAVDLRGDDLQSYRLLLATRPRCVIAFARDDAASTLPGPRWRPGEHEVTRWCRLLEYHGIGANPFRLDLPRPRVAIPP